MTNARERLEKIHNSENGAKAQGSENYGQELKRPNRSDRSGSQDTQRQAIVTDTSKAVTVAIRGIAAQHRTELDNLRRAKQPLIQQISDAYVSEIEDTTAQIGMQIVQKLEEVASPLSPFGLMLEDFQSPVSQLNGYQPKYLDSAD